MATRVPADVRLVISALPYPIFLYAPNGTIAAVNPAAERMAGTSLTGRTEEEVIASLMVCHPDGTPLVACDLPAARALAGQAVADSPLTITAADGTVFTILASASPIRRDGGGVCVISTWSDVTDLSKALDAEHRRRSEAEALAERQEAMAETLAQQNEELQAQDEELRQHIDELGRSQAALLESEQRVRRTLKRLLSPGEDFPDLELTEILDLPPLQELIEEFHRLTGVPASIVDLHGRILIGAGRQACCTQFHRVNPETCRFCIESDLELSAGIPPGESRLYRCRNNMWDLATPIMVGGRHVGNIFSGQFFLEDEVPDFDLFRAQAKRYGFDEEAYIAALKAIPRLKRKKLEAGAAFLRHLAGLLSTLSYNNLRLARALVERDTLTASLERSHALLARAQEIAHFGSWELDPATKNLSWSDEAYQIAGVPPSFEVTYEAFFETVHPDDRAAVEAAYWGSLREQRNGYEIEHRIVRHSTGDLRWVHEKCEHQRDATGRIVRSVGMVHDITDRKQIEQSLKDYAERLRASNEELQQFAYVASHDLQEPLRSIVSFSQLIDRRYRGRLDADADEYLRYIVENGQRMQALILDLLQVSRVDTEAEPFIPTRAGEVVADVLRSLERPLAEAGGTVVVDTMPTVMADAAQLEQVFTNLFGNAIKYRRPDVPLAISVSAGRHGDWWEFAIQDSGIGIEPEYYNRIFEMFRRLHTHDEYEGTGIGLAIVKKIVERHGGRVRVESTPGEGSTFFFTLPAV